MLSRIEFRHPDFSAGSNIGKAAGAGARGLAARRRRPAFFIAALSPGCCWRSSRQRSASPLEPMELEECNGRFAKEVLLIGRLGADPEIRRTHIGLAGRFVFACHVGTLERQGDRRAESANRVARHCYFNEPLCKLAEELSEKGIAGLHRGAARHAKWADQAGVER